MKFIWYALKMQALRLRGLRREGGRGTGNGSGAALSRSGSLSDMLVPKRGTRLAWPAGWLQPLKWLIPASLAVLVIRFSQIPSFAKSLALC